MEEMAGAQTGRREAFIGVRWARDGGAGAAWWTVAQSVQKFKPQGLALRRA
jgi:hypothetical protein